MADLRDALRTARSVSAAAQSLGVERRSITAFCQQTTDLELRALYRACVERGKRKETELSPHFGIWWRDRGQWVRIWGCDAHDEADAIRIALNATGRNRIDLRVEREERKR